MGWGGLARLLAQIERLEARGVITTDPEQAEECCGHARDGDGMCQYREHHPIYVERPF